MSNSDICLNTFFSLDNALEDLSTNIHNLKDNYQINDISNQIVDLGNKITVLNNRVNQVLNLYTMIDELKQRQQQSNNT